MGGGVAPQCSRNRWLARWMVWISPSWPRSGAGRATRRRTWSHPDPRFLCPSGSRAPVTRSWDGLPKGEGPGFATPFRPGSSPTPASSMNAGDIHGQPPVEPVPLEPWVPHAEDAVR
jgi:hypothetical protein